MYLSGILYNAAAGDATALETMSFSFERGRTILRTGESLLFVLCKRCSCPTASGASDRTRDRITSCAAGLPSARRCSPWLPALLPFPCSHFWQVRPSVPLRHPWPPHTQRRNRKRASRLTCLSCRCDCSDAGAPYRCLRPAHRAEDAQDGLGAACWWHRHRDARPRPSPPKGRKEHHLEDSSFRARAL